MDTNYFFKGMLLGFSIAAPVGPIGVLCIRRTLTEGRVSGFVSGLGAATADALYGIMAALGIAFISNLLITQKVWLGFVGGGYLCYLGTKTLISQTIVSDIDIDSKGLLGTYLSTLLLTVTNPVTILSFAAIFAGLGIATGVESYISSGSLVTGVFTGSMLWWLVLSSAISLLQAGFNASSMYWVNRLAGIILIGYGLLAFFLACVDLT